MNERVKAILSFWFGEPGTPVDVGRWFKGDPALDLEIQTRFGEDLERAARGELDTWAVDPSGALALVVVLDQFSRNAFRGKTKAFAQDARALATTLDAQAQGKDAKLSFLERYMFYMPMMHAEDRDVQLRGVSAFNKLVLDARLAGAEEGIIAMLVRAHDYAQRHQRVVARFGRFPSRNAILGRQSTPEENAFLAESGQAISADITHGKLGFLYLETRRWPRRPSRLSLDDVHGTRPKVASKAALGMAQLVVVMGLALFVPAGTLRFIEGWSFLALFFGASLGITVYLAYADPALLERRTQAGPIAEKERSQKFIQGIAGVLFLSTLVLPALDHRFGWSHAPFLAVVAGDSLVSIGFLIVLLVFRENTFTSSVIEVAAEQRVIDSGPYSVVRHPMYVGGLVLLAGIPTALGSLVGLATLPPFAAIIMWRLLEEERLLTNQLPGYAAYRVRTRWRLIPHVW